MDNAAAAAAWQPSLADVQQWLAVQSPGLITAWCTTHAEPLLGGFLEGWMTMNASALLAQMVAPLQQQVDTLSKQLAETKAQLADVQAKVQAQLLADLNNHSPSFATSSSAVSSPVAATPASAAPISHSPERQPTGNLGLRALRKSSASHVRPTPSEDGVDAQPDVKDLLRKRMTGGSSRLDNNDIKTALKLSTVTVDEGEQVSVDLSQSERMKQAAMAPARTQPSRGKSSGPIDIIVVEDLGVAQKIAHAALTRGHYKVEVAGTGELAVELYRKHMGALQAVLMDIHLPGISGIEATQKIRQIEREAGIAPVRIYGLTGDVDESDLASYQEAGMNGCILKGKLLADAVRQAMEESNNGVQFVNLCDKQGSKAATPAPKPAQAAASSSAAPKVPPFHGSVEQIRVESAGPQQFGTPRASQPRQLMQNRYQGSGQVKPGVGLPNAAAAAAAAAPTTPMAVGPNMLLVEDVRVSQKIALQALSRAGYKCIAADNGESAVEKYKQHASSFRYIIMDINLPGISGMEATEQIRQLEKTLGSDEEGPLLIFGLTGNVDPENLTNYEAAGMNGCILKGKVLSEAVKQAIEQSNNGTKFVAIT